MYCQTYIAKTETIYRLSWSYSLGNCSYNLAFAAVGREGLGLRYYVETL